MDQWTYPVINTSDKISGTEKSPNLSALTENPGQINPPHMEIHALTVLL